MLWFLIGIPLVHMTGCNPESRTNQDHMQSTMKMVQSPAEPTILIPAESFSSDYFPCSDCHSEIQTNPQRRELIEMHDDIVFDHDSENRWCLACHSENNRDSLILAGGKQLAFSESYKLCGQCHGPKIRDWKLGIHGKRTGEWNGEKEYLLCVHCHDPHSPGIKEIQPMPPPRRPEHIKIDSIYEREEKHPASP
jgi:uncharacterized CHY-type Zn-finger protein